MIRIIFLAIVIAIVYYLAKLMIKPSSTIRCSRCEGKGFWLGARGREKCDWCNGTGQLPRTKI